MTGHIDAIPTVCNGIRYRSRLEARFSIFLEEMGVRFEYEPKKYTLGDIKYIPDFLLPDYGMFIEMKPIAPNPLECEKARRLFKETQMPVMIVSGLPFAVEREMWTEPDEYSEVEPEPIYDDTGAPDYRCMLYCRMEEIAPRPDRGLMTEREFYEHMTAPRVVTDTYDTVLTDVALVYCEECQRFCVAERVDFHGRDAYMPIMGCDWPGKHAIEIELLGWTITKAYKAARSAKF